ncbi:MAG TPA: MmcB family DNA repair protein [Bryobacteraceae bacterium]|jgi:hypothetical protein
MRRRPLGETPHGAVVEDLAKFFYGMRIVFAEPRIDSIWLSGGRIPIPDVLTLERSYTRFNPAIYDVKVSRNDYLKDVSTNKWKKYLPFCARFYFACLPGLVSKKELPDEAGLIVRGDNGWSVAKAPRVRVADAWDQINIQALLMSGCFTSERVRRLRHQVYFGENIAIEDQVHDIGEKLAAEIARLRRLERGA